jgi:hypothetical protein
MVDPGLEVVQTLQTIRENHHTDPNPYALKEVKGGESVSNEAAEALIERLEQSKPSRPSASNGSTVQSPKAVKR